MQIRVPTQTKSYEDITYVLSHGIERHEIDSVLPMESIDGVEDISFGRILWIKCTSSGGMYFTMAGHFSGHIYHVDLKDDSSVTTSHTIESKIEISTITEL